MSEKLKFDAEHYLFVFIQVNLAMLLGDLRKLNTNITIRLPIKVKEADVLREETIQGGRSHVFVVKHILYLKS